MSVTQQQDLTLATQHGDESAYSQQRPMCVLTGSEDGTVRRLLHREEASHSGHAQQAQQAQHARQGQGGADSQPAQQAQIQQQAQHAQQGQQGQDDSSPQQTLRPQHSHEAQSQQAQQQAQHTQQALQRSFSDAQEIGFQAAGGAVKAIVAMPAGPGQSTMLCPGRFAALDLALGVTLPCLVLPASGRWNVV